MVDLCNELSPIIEKGHNIILGGDFNESINSPEGMSKKLQAIGLFNVFEERLQTQSLPRTHARGSRSIDHILATKYILDHISYAGMAPFGHIIDSDHRGLFIDIKDDILFQNDDIKLVYNDFRCLKSSIPKRRTKYMESVTKNWNYHNIDEKFENLLTLEKTNSTTQMEIALNKLDLQLTEILVGAENKCTKLRSHHLEDWSPEMMAALNKKRHCKSKLTQASKITMETNIVEAIDKFQAAPSAHKEAEKSIGNFIRIQKRFEKHFNKI